MADAAPLNLSGSTFGSFAWLYLGTVVPCVGFFLIVGFLERNAEKSGVLVVGSAFGLSGFRAFGLSGFRAFGLSVGCHLGVRDWRCLSVRVRTWGSDRDDRRSAAVGEHSIDPGTSVQRLDGPDCSAAERSVQSQEAAICLSRPAVAHPANFCGNPEPLPLVDTGCRYGPVSLTAPVRRQPVPSAGDGSRLYRASSTNGRFSRTIGCTHRHPRPHDGTMATASQPSRPSRSRSSTASLGLVRS
jgi:hypothetical protein